MSDLKAFAFRMPPELKAAAVALTKTHFYEWEGANTVRAVSPNSINDALIYLMRTGVRQAAQLIERDLNEARTNVESWTGFVKFFLDNPSADRVVAADFPEGSDMRKSIEIDDENNRDTGALAGLSRQDAFEELSRAQWLLTSRAEARATLLKAAA